MGNVLVILATLLAFHRPILRLLPPRPQLHSHQLLLRAVFVTIVRLLIWQRNAPTSQLGLVRNFVNSAAIMLASVTTEIYAAMPHCRKKDSVYCWINDRKKIYFSLFN